MYVDSGDSGPGRDDEVETRAVFTALQQQQQRVRAAYYLDVGGQHSEKYWGARFWRPLQFLFPAAPPQQQQQPPRA